MGKPRSIELDTDRSVRYVSLVLVCRIRTLTFCRRSDQPGYGLSRRRLGCEHSLRRDTRRGRSRRPVCPETKRRLAEETDLSEHYISEIVQELKRNGLIRKGTSSTGPRCTNTPSR
ncbi:hypothetical protein D8S78_03610 [Natrialba swarupiae]|nr:hypothetical protein [Natrialba swarupiae]